MEIRPDESRPLRFVVALTAVVAVLTVYRAWFIHAYGLELFSDEAYYWGWSRDLAWGYYSKPPMLAALIALTNAVFGDASELAVKSGALMIYPATTAVIFAIGQRLFDPRTGFYAALMFITMPGIWLSSVIISTDVVLLFFWALASLLFVRALQTGRRGYWLGAGVAGGMGLLSKYNMILFPLSVVIYLLVVPSQRQQFQRPSLYFAMLAAFVIFLPNLYWNWQNDFPTVRHTAEISKLGGDLLHPGHLAEFLGSQFAVFGVLGFGLLLTWPFVAKHYWSDERFRFLSIFSFVFLVAISVQSLLARAYANWAAPSYIAGCLLVTAWLLKADRARWLIAVIVLNIALGLSVYHLRDIASAVGKPLSAKTDPYRRITGWRALAADVQVFVDDNPDARLLSDDRNVLAWLIYYLRPHPQDAAIWNPHGRVSNHYDLTTTIAANIGGHFVFVTARQGIPEIAARFESVALAGVLHYPLYPDFTREFRVFLLKGFRGYSASRSTLPVDVLEGR